jgi:hypothetical protein
MPVPLHTTASNNPKIDTSDTHAEAPWKYVGYKVFSRWLASDGAFLMVRRFGSLNARVALFLQDEIVQLETELDLIDATLSEEEMGMMNNGSFRKDPWERRKKLIGKCIPEALTRYRKFFRRRNKTSFSFCSIALGEFKVAHYSKDSFLNGYIQLCNRPPIHKDDLATVKKWIRTNHKAIDPEEARFMDGNDDDLVGIHPKNRSWFRNLLDRSFVLKTPILRDFFERQPYDYDIIKDATFTDKNYTTWPNDERVEGLSTIVIAFVGLGMLIGPLWWLAFVNGIVHRLSIITGFMGIFFILVEVATDAGVFNALIASAAYGAVLMVFLQIVPN